MVLLLRLTSSWHAEQKGLPAETLSYSLGNSLTRLLGSTPLGSEVELPLQCLLPTGGGLFFILRFRAISAGVAGFSLSNSDTIALLEELSLKESPSTIVQSLTLELATIFLQPRVQLCPFIYRLFPHYAHSVKPLIMPKTMPA